LESSSKLNVDLLLKINNEPYELGELEKLGWLEREIKTGDVKGFLKNQYDTFNKRNTP
jgi:hypothetical protein